MDVAEMTRTLQGYAIEAGLPVEQARTLELEWTGSSFEVSSPENLDMYEFGDGVGPSPRPVHKAINRLAPELEAALRESLLTEASETVSPW